MERYPTRSVVRSAAFAVLVIVLAGCDGDNGGGPAAPAPGVPVISNLNATFGGSCTIAAGAGTLLPMTVNYSDSDGNVRGGTLQTTGRFEPSGTSIDLNFALPSAGPTVTGTTEGTISVTTGCVRFGAQTALNLSVALLDAAGNSSNILSARLQRPGGAPEVPRDGTGGGAMERLRP